MFNWYSLYLGPNIFPTSIVLCLYHLLILRSFALLGVLNFAMVETGVAVWAEWLALNIPLRGSVHFPSYHFTFKTSCHQTSRNLMYLVSGFVFGYRLFVTNCCEPNSTWESKKCWYCSRLKTIIWEEFWQISHLAFCCQPPATVESHYNKVTGTGQREQMNHRKAKTRFGISECRLYSL